MHSSRIDFTGIIKKLYDPTIAGYEKDERYLEDWDRIFKFMCDVALTDKYIDELEADIKAFIIDSQDDHKVFSRFFKKWASKNGFQQYVKIISFLDERTFQTILLSQSIFKDSALSLDPLHGKWIHMMQWYLIFAHFKATNFLNNSPLDLYTRLGYEKRDKLWEKCFDNLKFDAYANEQLTSPFELNKHIKKNPERWPTLSELLLKEQDKLELQIDGEYQHNIHIRKKHGKDLEKGFVINTRFVP